MPEQVIKFWVKYCLGSSSAFQDMPAEVESLLPDKALAGKHCKEEQVRIPQRFLFFQHCE